MNYIRHWSHTVHDIKVHIIWITKYRYHILHWDVQIRCRDLLRQICDANDIKILKWVVSKDHIHMHLSYPPKLSVSEIVRRLKWRTWIKLLIEFTELKRKYWWCHLWWIWYWAWSTGNVTDSIIQNYLEHHKSDPNHNDDFILE